MNTTRQSRNNKYCGMAPGFTFIELLVTMVVASIALGAIYAIYISVVESYSRQRELAHMQQNMRAAMYLNKNDLRNAGRNPLMNNQFGIIDVRRYNPDADDLNGFPGITMTSLMDADNDGLVNAGSQRTISYRVFDSDGDGRRELRRQDSNSPTPNAWDLVFDGIEDISFAYAFDADNDLDLDRKTGAGGLLPRLCGPLMPITTVSSIPMRTVFPTAISM